MSVLEDKPNVLLWNVYIEKVTLSIGRRELSSFVDDDMSVPGLSDNAGLAVEAAERESDAVFVGDGPVS